MEDLDNHKCGACHEQFSTAVWHCRHCDHHWQEHDTECGNCYEPRYEIHPAADKFPLIVGEEFEALCDDIAENGLQQAIVLTTDGLVLDGRNRLRACTEMGVPIRTWVYDGDMAPTDYVISLNLHRRHLTPSQRAAIAVELLPEFEKEAKARMQATQYRSEPPATQKIEEPSTKGEATAHAGAKLNVNRQYVHDAKNIREQKPELYGKVLSGDVTLVQAKREIKEATREQRREDNREKVAAAPEPVAIGAKFATIMIDPPWSWKDEGDGDQLGRAQPDYATMSIDELESLQVPHLADDDCHLYLWITNRSLPKGFRLIDAWGFRYITTLTWCKPSFGMGNYFRGSTEQILFAVKGSQPLKRKDVGTWFAAPRGKGGHSSKPVEAYELVESCSPGPYLEMFSRQSRADWTAWGEGNE